MPLLQSPLLRKLSRFVALTDDEAELLTRLQRHSRDLQPGCELIHEGQPRTTAFVLKRGWAFSYKVLPDGGRQIVDFHVPGDFLGLRGLLLHISDHSIDALTPITVSELHGAELVGAFDTAPRLAAAVLWAASREEAVVVEHLVNVGRRSAEKRLIHLLLEIGARLKMAGMGDERGFACPLRQAHLADALGLSTIHVNRILRALRDQGLLTFRQHRVTFHDIHALAELAGFDSSYLHLGGPALR